MKKIAKLYEVKFKVKKNSNFESPQITSSERAAKYAQDFYFEDIALFESCFVILLNNTNNVIGWYKASQGGHAATIIDTKIICKVAIDCLAASVVLVHNHPSGNVKPSQADIRQTEQLKKALETLNILLIDHIILSPDNKFFSFCDNQ